MGDWNRSTRECPVSALSPEIQQALQTHLKAHRLGPILDAPLLCVETVSVKKKQGLFGGGGQSVVVSAVLTPPWLVWVVKDEKAKIAVLSAQLQAVVATDYADSPASRLMPDMGINLTGIFTGHGQPEDGPAVSIFMGLGTEPAAQKFRDLLQRAIQAAKR